MERRQEERLSGESGTHLDNKRLREIVIERVIASEKIERQNMHVHTHTHTIPSTHTYTHRVEKMTTTMTRWTRRICSIFLKHSSSADEHQAFSKKDEEEEEEEEERARHPLRVETEEELVEDKVALHPVRVASPDVWAMLAVCPRCNKAIRLEEVACPSLCLADLVA